MKKLTQKLIAAAVVMSMVPVTGIMTNVQAASGTVVRLDPSEASPFNNGEFEGWGTSLCWWANRLGYSESLTQQAADAFFSDDGLGLDIARYNLGGGDDPTHNHVTRSDSKVPGVWDTFNLTADGTGVESITYDITNDQNQLNIAKAALEANPDLYVEGFSNSPPYFMTNSGCSSGGTASQRVNSKGEIVYYSNENNLKDDFYDDFAKFIADATLLFKEEGIEFQSYSPMNEPDTDYWFEGSGKQEGCHYDPGTSQSNMIVETRKALDAEGLTDVLVAGMDETDINKTVTNYGKLTDEAKEALGRIDTHTYSGSNRAGAKQTAVDAGKDLWMSEVDGGWNGFGLAERIILDMNGMQPSAWVLWDIVDFHKDSDFTAPDGSKPEANNSLDVTGSLWGLGMADHDTEKLQLANKYYFFGQFTKYINPGDTIIASSNKTLAAYNKKTGDIKIVALNSSSSDVNYVFDMSAFEHTGTTARVIRSNNVDEKWKDLGITEVENKKLSYTLPAQSITTFVIENQVVIDSFTADEKGLSYSYTVADEYENCDKYFAVYDSENNLKYISKNEAAANVSGDFTGCTPKLMVWNGNEPAAAAVSSVGKSDKYAMIKGGGNQISLGSSITLSVSTNIPDAQVEWSSSDDSIATVTQDGIVTAHASGNVTIYAKIGDFTTSRDFEIPLYTLTGTASWGSDSSRPDDGADYTKVADGDLSTYYDGVQNGWVQYDYGTPFKVSEINLAARSGNGMPERTVGGTVQGSNDGITWTDLYKITSAIPAGEYTTISGDKLTNNKAYRYYRYTNTENMANIAEFLIDGEVSEDVPENDPVIYDIDEFTDNFESNDNIFGASYGAISDGGNVVFASGLERFGNAFAPVKTTATSKMAESKTLTNKDKFRLTFTMFSGWESSGKDNTFALKDADGNELVALYITGGGYNLNQIRIGGENVLESPTIAQSRSNPGSGSKVGANGWNASGQPYVNTVGYNKTVEITIDGTGAVNVAVTGGMEDTIVSGNLSGSITLGTIELTGNYNSAAERTVSYDNFDGDIITYSEALAAPTPTPEPTDPPVLPENGELINLNFDNGDLTSSSTYGKAEGTPNFVTVDDKKCVQFDGTSATVIKLTDANGNSLLTGQDELTISFKVKPTDTKASWLLFAAPNDSAQDYLNENYLGIRTENEIIHTERYQNSGARSEEIAGAVKQNEWNDIIISVESGATTVYVNGVLADKKTSTVSISDMLGKKSVAYIGKANWGTGEYAKGYIDDFVIKQGALSNPLSDVDLGDLSNVTSNITLPPQLTDGTPITWTSSDTAAIANDGTVTVADDTKDVTLTAKVTVNGVELSKVFNATVPGKTAVIGTFAAYAENGVVKYTSEYSEDVVYDMYVELKNSEDTTVGEVKKNTASGSFDTLSNGTYKITCTLKNGEEVKKTVTKTIKVADEQEMSAYLFAHFVGTESNANEEQIYFSVSTDGTTWTTLNGGSPVLTSNVGEKGVRDPYILRGEDGKFFIIATDLSIYNLGLTQGSNKWGYSQTNGSKNIVVWESSDLVNWSEASLVKVATDNAGCTWAPEAVYDAETDSYMVFWASKTSDDDYAVHRVYKSYTKDFKTFSEPEIYIDDGEIGNIDTTIISDKGVYYRFTKNETNSSVTMMKSTSLSDGWKDVATYKLNNVAGNTVTGYEGPTIYKLNGENKWCLLLDYYSKSQGYKPFITSDITKGEFTSATDFTFDAKYRHGTVMPITQAEYDVLIAKYPVK